MFTGLIEEVGQIKAKRNLGGGIRFTIEARKIMDDIKIDDSIAIDGICLTVVSIAGNTFDLEAVEETLSKTTLKFLNQGIKVNLERALKASDRMGGHFVQGHVDCIGRIQSIESQSTGKLIWLTYPKEYAKYIIQNGSICVNGVSLTTARIAEGRFMASIIPHTWNNTTFSTLYTGTKVNLEFDVLAKYVKQFVN